MKHFLRRRIGALLCAAALGLPAGARANDHEEVISLNFVNAEIDGVIRAIGKITGRNFLIDPRVKGTINIVTNSPVPRRMSYDIMLSALRLQGFTAVEGNGITTIVPEADGKLHAVPVGGGGRPIAGGGGLVTQVFPLRYESAAQLVPVVRPLVSPNNTVTALASGNALVVTDYGDNIARIARIIDSIDQPQGNVQVVELNHASAVDLAQTVSRVFAENNPADATQRVTVMPDHRTNSLLVRAETPSRMAMARQLIASLDRPGAGGNIHVVYLKNAEAVKVAETLRAVLSGNGSPSPAAGASAVASQAAGSVGGGNMLAAGAAQAAAATTPSAAAGALPGGSIIQADRMSNALIITAPDPVYANLRHVIDLLDRRRAQVYVEALIAEVTADRAAEWGLQWAAGAAGGGNNGVGVIGGTNFSAGGNNLLTLIGRAQAGSPVLPGNGINIALGAGTVTIPGIGQIPSLAVLARFLENEVKANILSTPNLVTLDNEAAKIVIGRNVPFVTGQYVNTGGGTTPVNPFQTIERRDVGLTLVVKPQISEGGVVRLEIYQEASALLNGTDTGAGPITTKRSIESMVLVDDGSIIALGGLMEDSYASGEEKVPVLGDLPLLGGAFRYQTRNRSKTTLVVFLRPVILRDAQSYAGFSNGRYDEVIGIQQNLDRPERLLRGEPAPPVLPPRQPGSFFQPQLGPSVPGPVSAAEGGSGAVQVRPVAADAPMPAAPGGETGR